jgi:MFS transporter, DHA1 family, multidrug resistance protein
LANCPTAIGPFSDRVGRRPLLLGGLLVLGTGSVACALAPTFAALLAFRLLEAAGAAGTPVLARAIVRDTRRDGELAGALGLLATIMSVSPVVGPIVGGIITDGLGWRWLFGILALLAALSALAAYFTIPETLAAAKAQGAGTVQRQMRFLWTRPHFRRGVLYGAAFYFAFGAIYTMAPFILIDRFGLSHSQFGLAFAVMSVCLASGGIAGPRLAKLPMKPPLLDAAAGVAFVAGVLLFAFAEMRQDGLTTLVLALSAFGLAFGVALSVGAALTFSDAGEAAGTASSLSGFVQIGSAALGSALANLMHTGSVMPLGVILGLVGVAAFLAVRGLGDDPVTRQ